MSPASLNVSNFVTLRLRPENYPLWREQVLALVESQELTDFLTGEKPCPASVLPTLDEEALSHVIGLDTSAQEVPLNKYIQKFKEVCDSLAAIGHMVADKNKVFSLLTGLGARYKPFTTSMLKPPMPSYNEVLPLLQSYEKRLNLHSLKSSQYTAFYADKNVPKNVPKNPKPTNNFSSKGRGFIHANQPNKNFNNGSSSNASRRKNHRDITCQICGKKGHPAIHCSYRFNHSIQPDNLPQAFTALQLNSEAHHEEWTSDTGASAHMVTYIISDLILDKLTQQVLMRGLKRGNLYAIRAPPVALFSSRFWVA
ncbi:hypothetical protein Pint_03771 [Pistacia integerrima]|uniref:Uncharacterized protein n=1 Tax=Pistacia integerrima TaxID=434235 RepID=A0ACC0Z371_9ROSI|nr:hypothetical protein Pint_03771 [Pistacia integerrima]